MELYANIAKAKEKLHWKPIVGLDDGLNKTIKFYMHNAHE